MSYCFDNLKTLNVNLTLDTPGLLVSTRYPPVVDESTATLINNGPNNETGFSWRLQPDLQGSFILFDTNSFLINATSTNPYLTFNNSYTQIEGIPSFSNIFQGVVGGRTPINVSDLTDKSDPERAFDHTQQMYSRYMAQVLSASMRIPANSTSQARKRDDIILNGPSTLAGQFTSAEGTSRLIQHQMPKIVLQVMLGLMTICGLLAWIFGDLHRIVPWNPCTIAGTMVLFSGGKLCGPVSREVRAPRLVRNTPSQYDSHDASSAQKIPIPRSRYSRGGRDASDIELDSLHYDLPTDRAELDSMDQGPRTLYQAFQRDRSISDVGDPSPLNEESDIDERRLLAPDSASRRVSSVNEIDMVDSHPSPNLSFIETDTDKESVLIIPGGDKDQPRHYEFSIYNVFTDSHLTLRLGRVERRHLHGPEPTKDLDLERVKAGSQHIRAALACLPD